MDFLSLNEHIHQVRHEIQHAHERIADLESGKTKVRHRFIGGGDWVDITHQELDREKRLIAVFEGILARHPGADHA
jgi:hypothetical protein